MAKATKEEDKHVRAKKHAATSRGLDHQSLLVGAVIGVLVAVAAYRVTSAGDDGVSLAGHDQEAVSHPVQELPPCQDLAADCPAWRDMGECEKNPLYMGANCALSCNTCDTQAAAYVQLRATGGQGAHPSDAAASAGYAAGSRAQRQTANPKCKDQAAECPMWASMGECDKNERYMKVKCALSCDSCDFANFETRCKRNPNLQMAVQPGDMDAMFQRIETDPAYAPLQPRIVSRPPAPWVAVFDNFMSAEEAEEIIQIANRDEGKHFTASQGTGAMAEDGSLMPTLSSYRTSFTNWCEDDCINRTVVRGITERIVFVTGVPEPNHEFPQILRYYADQYYKEHNDYIDAHRDMPCGPRVYTFFLYLSDVEEGGHTQFPRLNISVTPKRGRALLWPSVLNERPMDCDHRTQHVAEPVKKGVKYSVNMWLHQFDFKAPNKIACTG